MPQAVKAYGAYTQNPAWQAQGPNPITGCFDIGCVSANNYFLGWMEAGLWTLGGEVAPAAVSAAGGAMCKVATPNSVRGLIPALRMLENLHGSPDLVQQLGQEDLEMGVQNVLPGGRLNPVVRLPTAPPVTGGQ